MSQKGNTLLIVLALVLVVGLAGYFAYSNGLLGSLSPQSQTSSGIFSYGITSGSQPSVQASSDETGDITSNNLMLNVTYPANGAILSSNTLTLTGKTTPGADVFVNDQQTKADAGGNFSLKITLDEGQNGLVVIANDANGNVSERDLSVNVQTF